jgi:hypothetical protein
VQLKDVDDPATASGCRGDADEDPGTTNLRKLTSNKGKPSTLDLLRALS